MENNNIFIKNELGNLKEVSLDFIQGLADFSITLNPDVGTTETAGYASALSSYFIDNKEDERAELYFDLISNKTGRDIMHSCVALSLVENYLKERPRNKLLLDKKAKLIEIIENQVIASQEINESRK